MKQQSKKTKESALKQAKKVKKQAPSSLEEQYRAIFFAKPLPDLTIRDPRELEARSLRTVTTYGAYEPVIG